MKELKIFHQIIGELLTLELSILLNIFNILFPLKLMRKTSLI